MKLNFLEKRLTRFSESDLYSALCSVEGSLDNDGSEKSLCQERAYELIGSELARRRGQVTATA
ncbi:MAG: hypothetical protein ABII72_04575 [Parcubacteria group bacterium]